MRMRDPKVAGQTRCMLAEWLQLFTIRSSNSVIAPDD